MKIENWVQTDEVDTHVAGAYNTYYDESVDSVVTCEYKADDGPYVVADGTDDGLCIDLLQRDWVL